MGGERGLILLGNPLIESVEVGRGMYQNPRIRLSLEVLVLFKAP